MAKRLIIVVCLLGAAALALAWPRLNDVETGRTPEYPDLKAREYGTAPSEVSRAAQKALRRLGWEFVGAGSGPRGAEIRAVHTSILRVKENITVKISLNAGRTHVSVRSQSESLPWDFGQNARNIREFCRALDGAL